MNPDYQTLNDGCDGDSDGLRVALGDGFEVVDETICDEGWGHHSYNAIFKTADGRIVHAECGGCSCGGSGSWSYEENVANAQRLIPEDERRG